MRYSISSIISNEEKFLKPILPLLYIGIKAHPDYIIDTIRKAYDIRSESDRRVASSERKWKWLARLRAELTASQMVRFSFATICFGWFCYNAHNIIHQYLQYNTIVTLRLAHPNEIDFPAVTICGPFIISDQVLEETYAEYVNDENSALLDQSVDIRDEYEERALADFSVSHIFDNLSVKLEDLVLKCEFRPNVQRNRPNRSDEDKSIDCARIRPIVASIYERRKCFTFFSQLNNSGVDGVERVESGARMVYENNPTISLQVWAVHNVWPVGPIQLATLILAVHPPSVIPTHLDFDYIRIYPNHIYDIRFAKNIQYLKPPPFSTNCRLYYESNPRGQRSRGDCINTCVNRETYAVNNCANYNGILTADLFDAPDQRICGRTLQNYTAYTRARKQCRGRCAANCVEESYDITTYEYASLADAEQSDARIDIKSDTSPYTIVEHSEEVTQTEFVGTLGGHAGIWLGMSAITLFNSIVKIIACFKPIN